MGPASAQEADQAAQNEHDEAAGVHRPRAQERDDELLGVAVEDQPGLVHVLAVLTW
jgi:hypothetical protein